MGPVSRPAKARQRGFTLIELIVVIIILGVLAATALPRFTDLQVQARRAKLQAAVGAVRGASALFHASCLAQAGSGGACPLNGNATVSMEGTNVTGVSQYPTADAAGIVAASGLTAATSAGSNVDYVVSAGDPAAGGQLNVAVPGGTGTAAATGYNCQFTYRAATVSGVVAAPTISLTAASSDCT